MVIWLAIVSSALLVSGVLFALRRPDPLLRSFAYLAPLLAAAAAGFIVMLRQRLAERTSGSREEWWAANLGIVIPIWAMAEATVLGGMVAFFLAGGWTGPATAAVGFVLLLLHAPPLLEPR